MFQFVYICPLFKYFSVLYCIFSSDFLAIWSDFTDLPGIAVRGTPFPYHRLCSRTRHSIFNDPQTFLRTFSDFAHFCFMTRSLWSRPYFPMSVTLYISLHLQVDPHPFLFESPAGMHLYSLLYLIDLSSDPLQFEWSLTTSSSCPYNCPFRKFIFLYLSTWSASGHVPSFCGFFFGFIAQNGLHSFFCIWPYKCSIIFSNVLLHFSYIVFWYFGYFIRFHSSACWETAVFMHFDGPSVPSENCCSSWFSITFLFQKNLLLYIFLWFFVYFLIFYRILLVYTSGIACLGHSPICQLQKRHYICPMYDLNQTTVRSVAVASVDFDGPLVPSENSYLFIFCLHFFHIFQYIFLWFFGYFFTFYWILFLDVAGIACLGNAHCPICQLQQRHYICPIYESILRSVAGETAASVDFDGPTVPSENCCPSTIILFQKNLSPYIFFWFFGYFIGFYCFMCRELPV